MIIAAVSDLMFRSKIREGAGADVSFVKSIEGLEEKLRGGDSATVFVDLNVKGMDPIDAIRRAAGAASVSSVVAFGSHVEVDAMKAARDAGATEVLPRSKFVTVIGELSKQRGAGKLTVLVFGLLTYAALYYLYHVIPIFYDFYELENQMQAIIKIASTEKDDVIRRRLQQTVKELGIPADPGALSVVRKEDHMEISLAYREIFYVTFRGKDYVLQKWDLRAEASGRF